MGEKKELLIVLLCRGLFHVSPKIEEAPVKRYSSYTKDRKTGASDFMRWLIFNSVHF